MDSKPSFLGTGNDQRKQTGLVRADSGFFSPSPITPYRADFSMQAGFRVAATEMTAVVSESRGSPKVSGKPPLARHRSLTEISFQEHSPLDALVAAFQCREARGPQEWSNCPHNYCVSIRAQWEHLKNCLHLRVAAQNCQECEHFQKLVLDHAKHCPNSNCIVAPCSDAKAQLEQYRLSASFGGRGLTRSTSFTMTSGGDLSNSFPSTRPRARAGSLTNNSLAGYVPFRNDLTAAGIGSVPTSLANHARLHAKAEEIVAKLEQEGDLFDESPYHTPETSLPTRPSSLPPQSTPISISNVAGMVSEEPSFNLPSRFHPIAAGQVLSPIAEHPSKEPTPSPSPLSSSPKTLPPLPPPSPSELIPLEEIHIPPGEICPPEIPLVTHIPTVEEYHFPTQEVLHRFDQEYLIPSGDGHYFERRDYLLNEQLGKGGFGTCVLGHDLKTERMFVMKRNNRDEKGMIESIRTECNVLSRLQHEHVIRFLGATMDHCTEQCPSHLCKMMLELAENGSLSDMLLQEDGSLDPLPVDQSLYYLQQILQAVSYLHSKNFLHLDIKAENVLVMNGGRIVKLADFGSAVHVDEIEGQILKKGWTPYFAAPEIIIGHTPKFSADVWSVLCVLVQMVTAKLPGCSRMQRPPPNMMFLVGNYTESDIEELVPIQDLQLDDGVADLFCRVFVRDPHCRPTAFDLLQHPSIVDAYEYEKYFDMEYDDEEEEEEEEGPPVESEEEHSESYKTAPTSLIIPPPLEVVAKQDKPLKRTSTDSGIATGTLRSSISGSSIVTPREYDSGIDTPGSADAWNRRLSFSMRSHQRQESIREYEEEESTAVGPNPESSLNFLAFGRHRSNSLTNPSTSMAAPRSWENEFFDGDYHSLPTFPNEPNLSMMEPPTNTAGLQTQFHALNLGSSPSYAIPIPHQEGPLSHHSLFHSNSIPDNWTDLLQRVNYRRRLSLNLPPRSESWHASSRPERKSNLRRTSSEVYVDRGPDIDTPDEKKHMSLPTPTTTSTYPVTFTLHHSANASKTNSSSLTSQSSEHVTAKATEAWANSAVIPDEHTSLPKRPEGNGGRVAERVNSAAVPDEHTSRPKRPEGNGVSVAERIKIFQQII